MMAYCAWVTHALKDSDVEKALVLGKSLRRVLSTKRLVVIVKPEICMELRDSLEETFDFVLNLDEVKCASFQQIKIKPDDLARIFALSFSFFSKCIYLPPNTLVLKNCDEYFDAENKITRGKESLTRAVLFTPSKDTFKKLVTSLSIQMNHVNGKMDRDVSIMKWVQTQISKLFITFKEPYSAVIRLQEKNILKNGGSLAIAELIDLPEKINKSNLEQIKFTSAGLLEKFVYGYWLEIYKRDVKMSTSMVSCDISHHPELQTCNLAKEPIAVVGMSCRYPSSKNIAEFWNLLFEGRDGVGTPPDFRWTKKQSAYQDEKARNTQAGFLNVPVDEFDAKFFGISPKEMIFIDPQHRILHELVWEALEDAGIDPLGLNGTKGGVFMGSWRNDYSDILHRSSNMEFFRGYMGNSIGAGAARISHLLGLTGPCIATESGCSAAMVAVHMACRSLQNGESNMAFACGVNLLLHPFTTDVMPMVTAPDGHSKTFDAKADGFGRAEGAGVLILKRLSEAVKDGDSIWGVIKGSAIAQEGISKSMGTPTVQCEANAMRSALLDANVLPCQVSYIETHGTGTIVGDPLEVTAIGKVYSEGRQEPLIIGSVKTNVGHTESCSGITGIMKVILSMKNEIIPQHRNFKELNPNINLDAIPAVLPLEQVEWPKTEGKLRKAGVSSFGITGTDGHVIVQEPMDYPSQRIILNGFERPLHIMTVSAKTEEALDSLLERYKHALTGGLPCNAFPNMAYTANVGRAHFNWRAAVVAKDVSNARSELELTNFFSGETAADDMKGKVCFLFTGQGSQYHGMAKELYKTNPVFQMHFDCCEEILNNNYNISVIKTFWGEENEKANRTLYSQTGIFVVEYSLMKLWESWGIKPDYVLGHSLGEFCAAVCAKILTFEEALFLVAERSRLIDALPHGKLLVIKAEKSCVETELKNFVSQKTGTEFWLDFAAINSADQTVLAGDSDKVQQFSEFLKAKNVKSAILQSSHAFHSRYMDSILEEYRAIANKILENKGISEQSCIYVSGMLGKIVDVSRDHINWPDYWVQHTRETVNFMNASKAVYNEGGCRIFLEIGPHPVLTAFTMMNNEGKSMLCLPSLKRNENDWKIMLTSLGKLFVNGGIEVNWEGFDQFYERKRVGQILPTYPFQGVKYWPNIINSTRLQIHPLLGSSIPNPTNFNIYQNNLSLQNLEYLKDHVIGTTVVFPGAGYIETLLMAGHAALAGANNELSFPRKPIQLENFRIEAPLELEEGVGYLCQTVVAYNTVLDDTDTETAEGLHVKFYHEIKDSEKTSNRWISHASGSISPYHLGSDFTESLELEDKDSYFKTIRRLKMYGKKEDATNEIYEKVADLGLTFGPAFRTLSKVWRGTNQNNEFLAEVDIPDDAESYLVHPILIDSMIQASVFHVEKSKIVERKLQVPIGCHKFIWFQPLTISKSKEDTVSVKSSLEHVAYIYSKASSSTVVLLNNTGCPVAALVQLEVIETSAKSIKSLLDTQIKSIPDTYKIKWKSSLGPLQDRVDMKMGTDSFDVLSSQICDRSDLSEYSLQRKRNTDLLVFNYITLGLLKLGWNPKINDKINAQQFILELGIKQHHAQLVGRFLQILEEEEILASPEFQSTDCFPHWTVKKLPATKVVIVQECQDIMQQYRNEEDKDNSDIILAARVGENLDKILAGTESALRILFPDDESKPSALKFYDCYFQKSKQIVFSTWMETLKSYKDAYGKKNLPLPVMRMLEVGAGTGFLSKCFLEGLEESKMKYEYHFTDISAAFFPAAEKRFEKYRNNIKFTKLNLEKDVTSQGFPPNYFDCILGAQVIHATKDIRETLINIRSLLKENGNFIMMEIIQEIRITDMIFGVLDGFWRQTDLDLRPNHPMMSAQKWKMVGKQTGFSRFAYSHEFGNAFIVYRVDDHDNCSYGILSENMNSEIRKIHNENQALWLIFYTDEEENYVQKLTKKFEYIGRKKIVLVKHSSKVEQNIATTDTQLKNKYGIRPSEKEDMDNLFANIKRALSKDNSNGVSSIEGVIVTWGLCGKERDQSLVAKPFLNLVQNVLKLDKKTMPTIIILTAGQYALADALCENPTSSTLLGMSRCIANEHSELKIKGIDMNSTEINSNMDAIFQEIFTGLNEESGFFYAIRGLERLGPKLFPEKLQTKNGSLLLPQSTSRFQLIHSKSKSIQDLEFGDYDVFTLKPNEIEVKVKASALNFKDILNILKPIDEFKDSDGVGFDFAGVVTAVGEDVRQRKVGDAVFGINIMGNALPSHIKLPEEAAVLVPDIFTFTEAACFPAVFSTAYYCLVNMAKAKRGETLLIHTASGGVGILTIQLAKHFGLKIICTAGNERKRAYLRSLGVQHVFRSRNTDFGKQILEVTNDRGIDIVMNSLTGPGFKEATLGACAKGARFVEMSKLNIWSEDEVAERRSDINYTIVDLTRLDEATSRQLLHDSRNFINDGIIKPIPYTRYDAQDIREALTFLQKARHIGKVVVTMPERKPGSTKLSKLYTPLYNERSTYLITGGLGGVGMEVCKYMVSQGAKNIVLVGRTPPSEKTVEVINKLKIEQSCNIIAMQADVGDYSHCQKLFYQIRESDYNFPPVRGIMHAAGTLADALIENQKWENFNHTYQAKVNGTWNLHELTKDTILEHFVLFSSITSPFGSPGQANHASACTFEDTFAHYRISHGLPATTINWGQFGQIGVAAEADVLGIGPFSPQQAMNVLDLIIRQNKNELIVASFEKGLATMVKYLPYTKRFIDPQIYKLTDSIQTSKKTLQLSSTQFWEEYNECKDERECKLEVVRKYTKNLLRYVLRLDADEHIDVNMDLQDMGVDSLMMLELKNHLQEVVGDRFTITQSAMKDCNTVNLLADRLVQIIEEEGEYATIDPPTLDEVHQLVVMDCKLPENIGAEVPGSEKKSSEIKVILMTGVTGVLGSHMLREILEECPQLKKVHCLVRTRGSESAEDRLKTILERKCLMSFMANFEKIRCIPGNFIEHKLGMSQELYEQLVGEVDAVIHCGAKVNHVEYYRNVTGGRSDARSVNVGGLLKVLEFCATKRTKHLVNASTLLAVHDIDEDCTLSENWPDPNSLCVPHNRGYQISKYVGDLLLREATHERGLPCKSFRYAELRGNRVTGGSLIETSHIMKSFMFFMKEGIMPEIPIASNFLPIDLACKITARIIFNDEAPNGVYNVSHPEPQLAQEFFPDLAEEMGHIVSIVGFEEYRQRVVESGEMPLKTDQKANDSLLKDFKELYKDEEGMDALLSGSTPSLRKYFENTGCFWKSKKLSVLVPELYENVESSYDVTRRDFLAAKKEGIWKKLGL